MQDWKLNSESELQNFPPWLASLAKIGTASAIALYLVYTNAKMMENSIQSIHEILIKHEEITNSTRNDIRQFTEEFKQYAQENKESRDWMNHYLQIVCKNTASDWVQRSECVK